MLPFVSSGDHIALRGGWLLLLCLFSLPLALGQQKEFVDTPEKLQKAVNDGVTHIIIRQHLDMRELDPDTQSSAVSALLAITEGTKSIRGNCAGANPLPDSIDLDPPVSSLGQCIITVKSTAIELVSEQSQLLLSDVYIRVDRTSDEQDTLIPIIAIMEASFFTGFTASEAGAVLISEGARAGFKDCTLNLNSASGFGAVLDIRTDAGAWMQACTMSSITDAGTRLVDGTRGIATAPGAKYFNDKDFHRGVDQSGQLVEPLPLDGNAIVELGFLVGQAQQYEQIAEDQTRLTSLSAIPIEKLEADSTTNDSSSSNTTLIVGIGVALVILTIAAIIVSLILRRRSLAKKLAAQKQAEAAKKASESMMYGATPPGSQPGQIPPGMGGTPPPPLSSGSMGYGVHLGSGQGFEFQTMDSNQSGEKQLGYVQHPHPGLFPNSQGKNTPLNLQNHGMGGTGSSYDSEGQARKSSDPILLGPPQNISTVSIPGSATRSSVGRYSGRRPSSNPVQQAEQLQQVTLEGQTGTWMTTVSSTTAVKPTNPGPGAKISERKAFLDYQLDTLRGRQVLTRLMVLDGVNNRRHGGQAVVQIAEDPRTRIQYAMKFYLLQDAFRDEKALYLDPDQPLGKFLPEVRSILEAGQLTDAHGDPLPPCIVMEKGESLDVWAATSGDGLDMVTGLQVLTHVADRLRDLHAAGYVHRDIKPGNIMWLPQRKRWTLIDFGCVARTGEQAPTGFSFMYAAPEVLGPHIAGARTTHVAEAIDAWAVGILAIEIFTGQPVFDIFQGSEKTASMITGEITAPWEDEEKAPNILKRCGHLKPAVLALLDRDPSKRPSMIELQRACKRIVSNTTVTPGSDNKNVSNLGTGSSMSGQRYMSQTNSSTSTVSVPGSTVVSRVHYTNVHVPHGLDTTDTSSNMSYAAQGPAAVGAAGPPQAAGAPIAAEAPLAPGSFASGSVSMHAGGVARHGAQPPAAAGAAVVPVAAPAAQAVPAGLAAGAAAPAVAAPAPLAPPAAAAAVAAAAAAAAPPTAPATATPAGTAAAPAARAAVHTTGAFNERQPSVGSERVMYLQPPLHLPHNL